MIDPDLDNERSCLIVFVKNVNQGQVKSRLARSIGERAAKKIYIDLAGRLLKNLCNPKYDKYIFFSSHTVKDGQWSFGKYKKQVQKGEKLGERMQNAFNETFNLGYSKVILIGSDIPYLTEQIILRAFEKLDSKDVVIGPAFDGGYYLIGLKNPVPELFQSMPWGSNEVFQRTRNVLSKIGMSCGCLPKLLDIDTVEDLSRLKVKDRVRYQRIIKANH